ncbi:integral membrane protein [Venturia nashicola]|nr:integral membrane protein [Venturia nashicola]
MFFSFTTINSQPTALEEKGNEPRRAWTSRPQQDIQSQLRALGTSHPSAACSIKDFRPQLIDDDQSDNPPLREADEVEYRWTPRNNRKGWHQLDVTPTRTDGKYRVPDQPHPFARLLGISPIVWLLNSLFVWLPLARPSSEFKNEITAAGGITAFIGAAIFVGGPPPFFFYWKLSMKIGPDALVGLWSKSLRLWTSQGREVEIVA